MATPVPFKRDEIPYTQARLKSLIKIYATFGGYQPDPNDPTAVPTLAQMKLIGAVTKVDYKNPRNAAERRELNYDTFAEIQEMVPGLGSFEVSFTSIMTYAQTFMEACGFDGTDIRFQTRPLAFALILPSPTPDVIPSKVLILRGSWLKDNPVSFSVEEKDDLRIIQEVPIACAGVIEV